MPEQQFEGRSAAEAAIKACEALGLTRQALKYHVVSETGEALSRRVVIAVDASAKPKAAPLAAPAAAAVTFESSQQGAEQDDDEPPRRDDMLHRSSGAQERGGRGEGGRRGGRNGGSRGGRRERTDRGGNERSGERGGRGGRSRRSSSAGRDAGERQSRGTHDGIEALLGLDEPAAPMPVPPSIEPKSPRATEALQTTRKLLALLSWNMTANLVGEEAEELHIDLRGADEKRVIGRKGEVLLALQFVLNRMLSREREEEAGDQMAVLDAGGYRSRRRSALENLAQTLAQRAKEQGKAVRLSPMSAHDRRVFHMALKEVEGIATRSEGDGLLRNLLIIPSEFV